MTTPYVTGAAPVTFISEEVGTNAGKQYQIPLHALTVSSSNQIEAATWASNAGVTGVDLKLVNALIASLTQQGFLTVVNPS
jgi:hypothetical protein